MTICFFLLLFIVYLINYFLNKESNGKVYNTISYYGYTTNPKRSVEYKVNPKKLLNSEYKIEENISFFHKDWALIDRDFINNETKTIVLEARDNNLTCKEFKENFIKKSNFEKVNLSNYLISSKGRLILECSKGTSLILMFRLLDNSKEKEDFSEYDNLYKINIK